MFAGLGSQKTNLLDNLKATIVEKVEKEKKKRKGKKGVEDILKNKLMGGFSLPAKK